MAYNKFITADGLVLLDLTADTVTANKLLKGITTHDRSGTPIIGTAEANSALPIEVATEAEMTALLTSGEVGGVYKYTGTTGTYENGALYVLEEEEATDTVVTAYFKKQSSSDPDIEIGYFSEDDYETHPLATITSTTATEITLTYPSGTYLYLSAIGFSNTFWYITADGETVADGDLVEPLYYFEVENGKTYTIHAEED